MAGRGGSPTVSAAGRPCRSLRGTRDPFPSHRIRDLRQPCLLVTHRQELLRRPCQQRRGVGKDRRFSLWRKDHPVDLFDNPGAEFFRYPGGGKGLSEPALSTSLPVIIEGSNEPKIDSEVFLMCGEAAEGERLLLGTAEARQVPQHRGCGPCLQPFGHRPVPYRYQSGKTADILLREIGVQRDHIVIDPTPGNLGLGFEYSYSAMERIRFSALKGDTDLSMPVICSAVDSLTVKEVREAYPEVQDEIAIRWELLPVSLPQLPVPRSSASAIRARFPC